MYQIGDLVKIVKPGDPYEGRIKKIMSFNTRFNSWSNHYELGPFKGMGYVYPNQSGRPLYKMTLVTKAYDMSDIKKVTDED